MLPYYPALRFKRGEYVASARIARDIQAHVQPRFIIPPPKEVDPEMGRPLTADEVAHLTGERIGKHWPIQPAFLDAQYIAPHIGEAGVERMFKLAQSYNSRLAIVAGVADLESAIFKKYLRLTVPRLGIYLRFDDIDFDRLVRGVTSLGCLPSDCVLFVDFAGAALDVDGTSGSVASLFDELGEAALWHRIVFQGSTFPATNPAKPGEQFTIPRHEWSTFTQALEECSLSPDRLGYGDYAADCGDINFPRKGGGRAIRHIRYTGEKDTIVMRGADEGRDVDIMRDVCKRLLDSGHFAGQAFSYADDRIWRTASDQDGPGNASMWREWNTAHHITRVVRDLGGRAGAKFADGYTSVAARQANLFEDIDLE